VLGEIGASEERLADLWGETPRSFESVRKLSVEDGAVLRARLFEIQVGPLFLSGCKATSERGPSWSSAAPTLPLAASVRVTIRTRGGA